jgi:ribosomal protein S18 acetylase RimI-like enzyme
MLPNPAQLFKVSSAHFKVSGAHFAVLGQNAGHRLMQPSLPQSLSLRPMRPTERAEVQRLGIRLFAQFGDYERSLYGWLRSPSVVTWVASHSQDGLVGFTLLGRLSDSDRSSSAYLLGIAVEPVWRRRGLGRLLLDSTLNEARKRTQRWEVRDLRLEVASGNNAARQLFESAGFAALGSGGSSESNYSSGDRALTMSKALTE